MSDLISRQAVESALYNLGLGDEENGGVEYKCALADVKAELKNMPSVKSEKCGDCISREELKQKFQWLAKATKYGNDDAEQQNFSYSTMMMYEIADMIEDVIDSCPSVEPERKTGKWVEYPFENVCGLKLRDYRCNLCTYFVNAKTKFCPNCGAKMEMVNENL